MIIVTRIIIVLLKCAENVKVLIDELHSFQQVLYGKTQIQLAALSTFYLHKLENNDIANTYVNILKLYNLLRVQLFTELQTNKIMQYS